MSMAHSLKRLPVVFLTFLVLNQLALTVPCAQSVSANEPSPEPPAEPLEALNLNRGYWRLIDSKGNFVLPLKFERPADITVSTITGAVWDSGHKYVEQFNFQIFNRRGEVLRSMGPFYRGCALDVGIESDGLISFSDKERFGFIAGDGRVIIPAVYEHVQGFREGLAAVRERGEWKIIDRTGRVVWRAEGKAARPNEYLLSTVIVGNQVFLAKQFTPDSPLQFCRWFDADEVLWKMESGNLETVWVSKDGKTRPTTDINCLSFSEDLATAERAGHWKYVNRDGQTVLAMPDNVTFASNFRGGVAVVRIDTRHDPVSPPALFGIAQPSQDRYGLIDKSGAYVVAPSFIGMDTENRSDLLWATLPNHMTGFINRKGAMIIPPTFDNAYGFYHGLANVFIENPAVRSARAQKVTPQAYELEVRALFAEALSKYIKLAPLRVSLSFVDSKQTRSLDRWCGEKPLRKAIEKSLQDMVLPDPPFELSQQYLTLEYSGSPGIGLVPAGVARDPFFLERQKVFTLQDRLRRADNSTTARRELLEELWNIFPSYADWNRAQAMYLQDLTFDYIYAKEYAKAEAMCLEAEKRMPGSASSILQTLHEKQNTRE